MDEELLLPVGTCVCAPNVCCACRGAKGEKKTPDASKPKAARHRQPFLVTCTYNSPLFAGNVALTTNDYGLLKELRSFGCYMNRKKFIK
jgi:hypothetical protein